MLEIQSSHLQPRPSILYDRGRYCERCSQASGTSQLKLEQLLWKLLLLKSLLKDMVMLMPKSCHTCQRKIRWIMWLVICGTLFTIHLFMSSEAGILLVTSLLLFFYVLAIWNATEVESLLLYGLDSCRKHVFFYEEVCTITYCYKILFRMEMRNSLSFDDVGGPSLWFICLLSFV